MDTRRSDSPQNPEQNSLQAGNTLSVSQDTQVLQPLQAVPQQQKITQTSSQEQIPGGLPPANDPPQPPPIEHLDEEESTLPLLIKLGVGFSVLIIIGFLLFTFVFSRFTSSSGGGKVTLQWWGLWEDPAIMQSLISDFEKSHPDITVQYTKEDPRQYSQRLLTRIQVGNGPDIFRYHVSWMPMVQSSLSPLSNDAISKQDFMKNYYPVVQQDLVKNGAIYGIPLEIDTLALFTNNQLFQSTGLKPPTNWTDFVTAARALTVKDSNGKIKTAGGSLGTFDNITHAPDVVSLLLFQNGTDIFNLEQTRQSASDALIFYTAFANGDGNVWSADLDPSLTAFAKGNLAMYIGYSYDVFTIKTLNQNVSFSVNPVPHLLGRNMTVASYWVEGVSNRSKHQKEAMLFMNFLSQKDTEQKLYSQEAKTRLFGEPYARVDLADSLKNDPLVYPFVSQAKDAQSSFFAGETYDTGINAQMNGYIGNAVRSVLANSSAQSSVDQLIQGVHQVLSQYAPKQQ